MFATPRALALSYVDPYVDFTGEVRGYAVVDLRVLGKYDWRLSATNVWKVERMLLDYPHRRIRTAPRPHRAAPRAVTCASAPTHPDVKPVYYRGRERWTPLPEEFRAAEATDAAAAHGGAR